MTFRRRNLNWARTGWLLWGVESLNRDWGWELRYGVGWFDVTQSNIECSDKVGEKWNCITKLWFDFLNEIVRNTCFHSWYFAVSKICRKFQTSLHRYLKMIPASNSQQILPVGSFSRSVDNAERKQTGNLFSCAVACEETFTLAFGWWWAMAMAASLETIGPYRNNWWVFLRANGKSQPYIAAADNICICYVIWMNFARPNRDNPSW